MNTVCYQRKVRASENQPLTPPGPEVPWSPRAGCLTTVCLGSRALGSREPLAEVPISQFVAC